MTDANTPAPSPSPNSTPAASAPEGPRTPTPVDAIAEAHFEASIRLSPLEATYLGVPGHDGDLDDFSPAGYEARSQQRRETLAALADATPVDDVDRATISALRERLELAEELRAAGLEESELNVLASPLQAIHGAFDLMPTNSVEQWATFAERLDKVPAALAGWTETLLAAAAAGRVSPRRQVAACARQCADLVADDGWFALLLAEPRIGDDPLPADLLDRLTAAAGRARDAYATLGESLTERLLPLAPEADACGREAYSLHSRSFLGATVDLEETYAWGQEELARITQEMAEVADRIVPGGTVDDAIAALDADPAYQLHGTEALRVWMQAMADNAIDALGAEHFDIPGPARRIACMIAPTHTGQIYYTGPSDDFSRPGQMWWSVPKGVTEFTTWRELTTVYHEGVPGHHLQIAQTVHRKDLLNRWRRLASWTSGHGEGWALYAERLMQELGYMDDPGHLLGLLDGQSLRAARVVIDIGIHCGFEAPAEVGGGEWTYDKAWTFLTAHARMDEAFLRFELDRYLGWPGQAPSYKIGQRLWEQLRDEAREREGDAFDLKAFHRRALDVGGVGLDTLRSAVLGSWELPDVH
ncbi:DUF885 domain-containing protein [Janibacter sp. G1551]|uniref:DUF885 domain-containing protein n=1 Tax=Janibacter sp. G1551 TaxID=3420440 RepID=UPI003D04C852